MVNIMSVTLVVIFLALSTLLPRMLEVIAFSFKLLGREICLLQMNTPATYQSCRFD